MSTTKASNVKTHVPLHARKQGVVYQGGEFYVTQQLKVIGNNQHVCVHIIPIKRLH